MKIGYGTYGLPQHSPHEALPRLAQIGYEAVEICASAGYPTAPDLLTPGERASLRRLLADTGLELSGLMAFVNLLPGSEDAFAEQLRHLRAACLLAGDLLADHPAPRPRLPIISTLGSGPLTWERDRERIAARVAAAAATAAREGCRFALEPHVGGMLADPQRAVDLIEAARLTLQDPSALGLNFDISHFAVAGYSLEATVDLLAPYALHTHVKDGRLEEGRVRFLLPGEGEFDYVAYFRRMARAGWTGPITVEITAQIFRLPEYQPWEAARFSLATLRAAREAAGLV